MNEKVSWQSWGLIGILALLWGTSFILMKRGLLGFGHTQVAAIRIAVSFIALFPFWFFAKREQLTRKNVTNIFFVALMGSGIPPFLFALAQTKIDSSLVGILNSLTPIFTLLIGYFAFNTKTTVKKFVGILLGMVGAVVIILVKHDGSFESDFAYSLLIVLASFLYGAGANLLKERLTGLSPITITTAAFTFIGPVCLVYLFAFTDFLDRLQYNSISQEVIWYLVLLGTFGTAYALVLFNYLIQRTSALLASTVTYLIPIVAVIWGVIDGEPIGTYQIGGMVLILVGIYITGRD